CLGAGLDCQRAQRPRARGAASARRASEHRPAPCAPVHLGAHRSLAREEPDAEARRLLPQAGARSTRRRSRLKHSSPTVGDTKSPANRTLWAVSEPRARPILRLSAPPEKV